MAKQLLLWLVALCALPAATQATILLNENFDELTPQNNAVSVGAFAALTGSPVDIVSGAQCPAPASGVCVQLDGSGPPAVPGRIQSRMTFAPGTYFVSFDLVSPSGVTTNSTVSLGSTRLPEILGPGDSAIVKNQPFTVGSTLNQLFIASNTLPVGAVLDNVIVSTTPIGVGVPEPATWGLLALGIAAVGVATRRRG